MVNETHCKSIVTSMSRAIFCCNLFQFEKSERATISFYGILLLEHTQSNQFRANHRPVSNGSCRSIVSNCSKNLQSHWFGYSANWIATSALKVFAQWKTAFSFDFSCTIIRFIDSIFPIWSSHGRWKWHFILYVHISVGVDDCYLEHCMENKQDFSINWQIWRIHW